MCSAFLSRFSLLLFSYVSVFSFLYSFPYLFKPRITMLPTVHSHILSSGEASYGHSVGYFHTPLYDGSCSVRHQFRSDRRQIRILVCIFFPLELCTLPTISCSWPFLVASPVFITIGSGLLYLLDTNTSSAKIIGFQILAGVGVGFGMQNSLLAMQ